MLKQINTEILRSLEEVISQLSNAEYSFPISELSDASVGQHTRHVLEFYECLLFSNSDCVCYDNRKRDILLENDVNYAIEYLQNVIHKIENINSNTNLTLKQTFNKESITLETSLKRELLYNIEHSIHHLAIIKIGLQLAFPQVKIPENFGIAYSTVSYAKM